MTDWPDLGERGLWWFHPYSGREYDWLANLKLNHLEILCQLRVEKGKPAFATIDSKAVEQCRLRAITMMPAIYHLEQLNGTGIFEAYPETRARENIRRECSRSVFLSRRRSGCSTNGSRRWRDTVESNDVMVWFSENDVHCTCPKCKPMEQFQQELNAMLHACTEARKVRPTLRLRILLTQGSHPNNITIIKSAPREVGITYYDGGQTYTLARRPMIYPELREAMKGRWFGCYPTVCAAWYAAAPFSGAAYMQERMRELRQAGVVSLAGYAVSSLRVNDFLLSAAAEYAWNSSGRTPREFVLSWATRQRLADPEKVAQWWQLVEEPQRNLYLSQFMAALDWNAIDQLLTTRQPARPGSGMLTGFPRPGELEDNIASVQRALPLAESLPHRRFADETRFTLKLLEGFRSLRDLTVYMANRKSLTDADKKEAAALVAQTHAALARAEESLTAWDRSLELWPGQEHGLDIGETVNQFHKTCQQLDESAKKLGLNVPH